MMTADRTERTGCAERRIESGVAAPGRGGRISRLRKTAAELRVFRDEDLELVSRSPCLTAATVSGWPDVFLAAGEAALVSRKVNGEALESPRLKAKLGEVMVEREPLHEKIAVLEAGRPWVSGGRSHPRALRQSKQRPPAPPSGTRPNYIIVTAIGPWYG